MVSIPTAPAWTPSDAPMRTQVSAYIKSLQSHIVESLEILDKDAPFKRDAWERAEGGEGISCVLASGKVLEKAGVNISIVHGRLPPAAIKQMRADHDEIPYDPESGKSLPFFAAGISLVIHPRNPHVPTVHANYRYFEITEEGSGDAARVDDQKKVLAWWFGGGSDLTPSYLVEDDAKHFHRTLKNACDAHGVDMYPAFKKWCDEYFYLPHRKETRGVGGIFFDDLSSAPHKRLPPSAPKPSTPEEIFTFIRTCGDAFIPSYVPILAARSDTPFTEEQRRWQLLRRGRYVEFNLVYDRGTKFGLQTPGARIESILMSLPETARWEYMSDMGEEGTEEGKLVEVLKTARDWV
ncbi:hypothetical protein BOTBODRAFT_48202 [Botryobasidium botryosum FD-172 SS1]|uniref:coproporphyrinogen oxidase n=1 Tax=Botryobasidium botryosum (strain FD-172 SS1) TaxID=930990 RepID=A0A067M199_BOTB1|nr:hypothetical protein BOTBODRAFT_48202 [Botryobasidium botryosum FD-172 SS1]